MLFRVFGLMKYMCELW